VLEGQTTNLIEKAITAAVVGPVHGVQGEFPQGFLDIDRCCLCIARRRDSRCLGSLQSTMGARFYANDFNLFGRTWQVNVQADNRSHET